MEYMKFELPAFTPIFLLMIFVLLILWRWKKNKSKNSDKKKLPPGPRKLPFIGSMHHLLSSLPHHSLRDLARKHGPIMHLQLGEVPAIVISSPKLAKEVLKTHDLAFASRPQLLATKILSYNNKDIVFSPYGDYWRNMRKICILELLSAKNVRSFSAIREEEISRLVESIKISSSSGGVPIDLTHKAFLFTSSMTCRAAFGKICRDQDRLIELMKETISVLAGFHFADLFPSWKALHFLSGGAKTKLLRLHREVDVILDDIINEHTKNLAATKRGNGESGEDDLVDVLLKLKERPDLIDQFPITNDNIKAIIFDIFSAGTETSSTTLIWAMAEMMRNPNVMSKAQAEVRHVLKGKKNSIQDLKYLKLIIKETLRLHPPVPLLVPRESREEATVEGFWIPRKTKVFVNAWAIGRDPDYWKDQPEVFKPERFGETCVDFLGNYYEYIPFGAGRRICPGISFRLANVELPMAHLLYHFDWKLPDGIKPEDLDMSESSGITATRRENLRLIATSWDSSA